MIFNSPAGGVSCNTYTYKKFLYFINMQFFSFWQFVSWKRNHFSAHIFHRLKMPLKRYLDFNDRIRYLYDLNLYFFVILFYKFSKHQHSGQKPC